MITIFSYGGKPLTPPARSVNEAVMRKDCIEWGKYRNKQGYGVVRVGDKTMLAHRVAWRKANGEIPSGMKILHKCDYPPCVNPDHLALGTQCDNVLDCKSKGRISKAARNNGTTHGASKISEQTAIRMKMLHKVIPSRIVSEWLGLNQGWAGAIMRGDQWKHVTANTRYGF